MRLCRMRRRAPCLRNLRCLESLGEVLDRAYASSQSSRPVRSIPGVAEAAVLIRTDAGTPCCLWRWRRAVHEAHATARRARKNQCAQFFTLATSAIGCLRGGNRQLSTIRFAARSHFIFPDERLKLVWVTAPDGDTTNWSFAVGTSASSGRRRGSAPPMFSGFGAVSLEPIRSARRRSGPVFHEIVPVCLSMRIAS